MNSLHVLVLTDLHLHEWPLYATRTEEGKHARLMDGISILRQASAYMKEHSIQRGWFLGDINHIHDKMLYSVQSEFTQWFRRERELQHKWVFFVGNHDRDTITGEHHCLESYHGPMEVVATPKLITQDGFQIACFPWIMDGKLDLPSIGKADIGLFHHDFANVLYRGRAIGRSGSTKVCEEYYPLSLCGHYHDRIKVSKKFLYLGAPMQHDIGDRGKKRGMYHLVLRRDQPPEITFIPTQYPRFVRVIASKPIDEAKFTGNFVQIIDDNGLGLGIWRQAVDAGARYAKVEDPAIRLEGSAELQGEEVSIFDFDAVVSDYVEQMDPKLKKSRLVNIGLEAMHAGLAE